MGLNIYNKILIVKNKFLLIIYLDLRKLYIFIFFNILLILMSSFFINILGK